MMVVRRRIDIDDTDADYMDGDEEEDIFFGDDEISNEFQAPTLDQTMVNPVRTRRAAGFKVAWEALRLPGARGSSTLSRLKGAALDLWAGSKNIRSSPYAYVIPASSWTQYINNMSAADVAAELSAEVSEFEKASLYLFAEEWRSDVTHEAFKRRLIDHPLVNVGQEVAKGQLVFDLILGNITAKGGRPDTKYTEMMRLAMDILNSIRLRYYTYYSVNLLHGHEGAALYQEFLSRYTPLEAHEVAMIQEISQGIQNQGRTYAVNTSNPMADAVTTFNLMMRVVESYNIGDTLTARAGIAALLNAPINYKSNAKYSLKTDNMGRTALARDSDIIAVAAKSGNQNEAKKGNKISYILKKDIEQGKDWPMKSDGTTDFGKLFGMKDSVWVIVGGVNDPTPKGVFLLEENKLKIRDYAAHQKFAGIYQKAETQTSSSRNNNRRRPKRGSVRTNPSGVVPIYSGEPKAMTKNLGAIFAEVVIGRNIVKDVGEVVQAIYRGLIGGRTSMAEKRLAFGIASMQKELSDNAKALGGNAVANLKIDYEIIQGSATISIVANADAIKIRGGVRQNPVAIGKGQHFFIQLRPKSQFSFNAKQKKMGSTAKGAMTVVGTPGRDTTGFVDLFGGFEKSGYVAWKGTHKDSGSSKAWMVQLPRKYGKGKSRGKGGDTVFKAARVTDKETGKSYRTIKPFTADKKIKAAWNKFVSMYGEPVFADDPKRPNLFRVRRKNRGTYYKRK